MFFFFFGLIWRFGSFTQLQLSPKHGPQASGPLPVASYPTTSKWELDLGAFHDSSIMSSMSSMSQSEPQAGIA